MKSIGVRELRQRASEYLKDVQAGESFEVTVRGRTIALLVPVRQASVLDRLVASGRVIPASGDVLDLGPPLKRKRGVPLASEILRRAREHER